MRTFKRFIIIIVDRTLKEVMEFDVEPVGPDYMDATMDLSAPPVR